MKCEACDHDNLDGARFCANCGAVLSVPQDRNSLVGQMIGGRFRIVRVLGEGGMGVVYEGEQQMGSTIRKVAVKTLHPHLSHDPSVAARFHRECGTVAQLEHPNIIKVYDFGATPDGTLYIAMEFVAGKSLSALIEEAKALPADRVLKITKQVSGALAEAHRLGIIHRDLKPENVVLTERHGETDVVKLLDFGIAARTESADAGREQKLTQQGMVLGTPPYMSPEQFTGKALDVRSDIYSLGIMAYEMLTGRLPFEADTPWQWATEHMTSQPIPFEATPVASQIPERMRDAIMRSLSKDREQRQASVTEFYKELAGEVVIKTGQQQVSAHSGTAAMEAPPDFLGAGTAKTAAMPQQTGGGVAGPAPYVPAAPPRSPKGGGGKGLIVGLASAGGVLLIGIIVVAANGMGGGNNDGPDTLDLGGSSSSTPPAQTVAPESPPTATTPDTPDETPPDEHEEDDPKGTTPVGTVKGTGGAKSTGGTTPSTGGKPSTPPPQNTTPPATTTPPPSGNACQACVAATSSNPGAVPSLYGQCTDANMKRQCKAALNARAAGSLTSAKNGDCGKVRAYAAAAQAIGVSNAPLQKAIALCK